MDKQHWTTVTISAALGVALVIIGLIAFNVINKDKDPMSAVSFDTIPKASTAQIEALQWKLGYFREHKRALIGDFNETDRLEKETTKQLDTLVPPTPGTIPPVSNKPPAAKGTQPTVTPTK